MNSTERTTAKTATATDHTKLYLFYLAGGAIIEDIHYVRGTAYLADDLQALDEFIELPSLEDILKDREAFAKAYNLDRKSVV